MNAKQVSVVARWTLFVALLAFQLSPARLLGQTTYQFTPIATSADGFTDLGWPSINNHGVVSFPGVLSSQLSTYKGDGSSRTFIGVSKNVF